MAFVDFLAKYPAQAVVQESSSDFASALHGFTSQTANVAHVAGSVFGGGIYRLYSASEVQRWTEAVTEIFPAYKNCVRCFGRDWLGNQFCLDGDRAEGEEKLVVLFEVSTGDILEIPASFSSFHEEELSGNTDTILVEGMFLRWRSNDPKPLAANECVGYKVPLFLGGKDDLPNLERSDADVYWHLSGQLVQQTR